MSLEEENPAVESSKGQMDSFFRLEVFLLYLQKISVFVCIFWFIVTVLGGVIGIRFLGNTTVTGGIAEGSPSALASAQFDLYYPKNFTKASLAVLVRVADNYRNSNVSIYTTFVQQLTFKFAEACATSTYATSNPPIYDSIIGYYLVQGTQYAPLGPQFVNSAGTATIISIFHADFFTDTESVTKLCRWVQSLAATYSTDPRYEVEVTGYELLFDDTTQATTADFELIDAIVLPISLIILGVSVNSSRMILISFLMVVCTLLGSFLVMYPISIATDINSFTPSIMLSIGIAVSFDYCLFLSTRFREEIMEKKRDNFPAMVNTMRYAGHVIVTSGSCLSFTFIILTILPEKFLTSVGIAAFVTLWLAICTSVTLFPALVFTFPIFFTNFELIPACCCEEKHDSINEIEILSSTKSSIVSEDKNSKDEISQKDATKMIASENSKVFVTSFWRRVTQLVVTPRGTLVTIIVVLAICLPIGSRALNMYFTFDTNLVFVTGSDSLKGFNDLQKDFPPGQLDPYKVLVVQRNGILNAEYFQVCSTIVSTLLNSSSINFAFNSDSISAICFMRRNFISFNSSLSYLNPQSNVYNTSDALLYRFAYATSANPSAQASEIQIQTIINPQGPLAIPLVDKSRIVLDELQIQFPDYGIHLVCSSCEAVDRQRKVNGYFPLVAGLTVAVLFVYIGYMFESLFVPLRLIFSIFLSVIWVYGMAVIIFQEGGYLSTIFPTLDISSGIFWLIPIMTFSIMVGLALDYDVFLFSRVLEFRNKGFSDTDSVVKAVEKTGSVITAAGLIMAVSFGGLLGSRAIVLNQYGFILCFSVLFDTFVVRTLLVPACVFILGKWNWWPYVKLEPTRKLASPETEANLILEDAD